MMRTLRRTTAVLSLMALLTATACTSDESEGPRENGVIVFGGFPDERSSAQFYSVNEDGSGFRQLTNDDSFKTSVTWSPDGSRLAYAALSHEPTLDRSEPQLASVYVLSSDGRGRSSLCRECSAAVYTELLRPWDDSVSLPTFIVADALAWSPNGSRIAAPSADHGVLLIDPDSGTMSTVRTPEPVTAIAWSPDGRRLALSHTWFMQDGDGRGEAMAPAEGIQSVTDTERKRPGGIYLMDVDTGRFEEVVSTKGVAHVHGWSADGELIAFTQIAGGGRHAELTAYSVEEERAWPLVPAERRSAGLGTGWSPVRDELVALVARRNEEGDVQNLWVTSSHADSLRGLPLCQFKGAFGGDNCIMERIVWSPDGATIAYRAFIAGSPLKSVIVLQDVDNPRPRLLHISRSTFYDGRVANCCMAWLPAVS